VPGLSQTQVRIDPFRAVEAVRAKVADRSLSRSLPGRTVLYAVGRLEEAYKPKVVPCYIEETRTGIPT
jgi:hypothetical protein